MLRLNKKTEYAFLALRYMSRLAVGELASTRAVAAHYNIPEMLLAKVMQQLKRGGVVQATKGACGGYSLDRPLAEIGLTTVLDLFGEQVSVVECLDTAHDSCQQLAHCDIKGPLEIMNNAMMAPLRHMSIADLFTSRFAEERTPALSIFR